MHTACKLRLDDRLAVLRSERAGAAERRIALGHMLKHRVLRLQHRARLFGVRELQHEPPLPLNAKQEVVITFAGKGLHTRFDPEQLARGCRGVVARDMCRGWGGDLHQSRRYAGSALPGQPPVRAAHLWRIMVRTTRKTALAGIWILAALALFRWWNATFRVPGVLLWTSVFLVLFLVTAAFLYGPAFRERNKEVWTPAYVWVGLIVITFIGHMLVPTFRAYDEVVQSVTVVGALDLAFPLWIGLHTAALVWGPLLRTIILVALVPAFLLFAWGYMIRMPGASHSGTPPPLDQEEREISDRLESHVVALAGQIGERNYLETEKLEDAARYLERTLAELGYQVASQHYEIGSQAFRNLEASLPGREKPNEIIVVGAHYDTAEGAPGADDNGSGTAAVLELARILRSEQLARTVRFVLFVNEEPPHFNTRHMGSRVYAARASRRREDIAAMMSIESIGYYSDAERSQKYPFPFNLFYPKRGDFIGFVANLTSRSLVRRSIEVFRETTAFPSQGVASPGWIPGVNWSDHASFWLHGYRAIMISDTAPFRYPFYHTTEDTPDKLDYDRTARVVAGLSRVVRDLAGVSP